MTHGVVLYCGQKCYHASKSRSIPDRFWEKVQKSAEGCWLWTGATKGGRWPYGAFVDVVGESPKNAHRVSWELTNGPIPEGMYVCHKCDVPKCVRPVHLFLGSALDNMRDMARKTRSRRKLTPEAVLSIRAQHANGMSQQALAGEFGVTDGMISTIVNRKTWKEI